MSDRDIQLSLLGKATGMELALSPEPLTDWKAQFRRWIIQQAQGSTFTSEDVLDAVGLPSGKVAMNANNAVGAMISGMARKQLIAKTGRRVYSTRKSSHAAELIVWERT